MRLTRRDIQNAIKNEGSLRRDGGRFADSKEVLENLAKGGVDTPYACRDEPPGISLPRTPTPPAEHGHSLRVFPTVIPLSKTIMF